jgi:hypothetical protein
MELLPEAETGLHYLITVPKLEPPEKMRLDLITVPKLEPPEKMRLEVGKSAQIDNRSSKGHLRTPSEMIENRYPKQSSGARIVSSHLQ